MQRPPALGFVAVVALVTALLVTACDKPAGSVSVAVPSESAIPDSPRVDAATAAPTTPARPVISPGDLATIVVEAVAEWSRYTDGERQPLPMRFPPLGRWQLLGTGDIAYQHNDDKPVMVLRVGQAEPDVLVERPTEQGRHITLVGKGRVDGRDVALVADGTATALNKDDGSDIVAVDAATGDRTILVDDAASAWEGGVALASVEGRWLVYHSTSVTTGEIVAVDHAAGERRTLRDIDHEEDAIDFQGLQLLRDAEAPTAVLLTYHRAAYPKDPVAALEFLALDSDRQQRHLTVPGISWEEGLPWSLSAGDRFLVVNRQEEQAGPASAVAYDTSEQAWYELARPAVLALQ